MSRKKNEGWLRADVVFIVAYAIACYQVYFLHALGTEPKDYYRVIVNPEVLNYAVWLCSVAFNFILVGYWFGQKNNYIYNQGAVSKSFGLVNRYYLDLVLAIGLVTYVVMNLSYILKGYYDVSQISPASKYTLALVQVLVYLRVITMFKDVNCSSALRCFLNIFKGNQLGVLLVSLYVFIFLYSGSRGEALRVFLLVGFCYSFFVKPLSLRFVLGAMFLGALVFGILGAGRGVVDSDKNVFARGVEQFTSDDYEKTVTDSLAGTIKNLNRAIDLIPNEIDYLYGATYTYLLISPVPFLTSIVDRVIELPWYLKGSSIFFTYLAFGRTWGHGEGGQIVGDIYINFGVFGVCLILFLFGYLMSLSARKANAGSAVYFLLLVTFLMDSFAITRGSVFMIYKDFIYFLVVYYLMRYLSKKNNL